MREDRFSIDIPKRWLRRAVIAVAVGMLVLPAAAWAGHQFTDVPDSNIFHEDIDWMADNNITLGCNPNDNPANTKYCPDENVTREQMAAFLHRMDTNDVFVTPEEADAEAHFAVIAEDGEVIAEDELENATKVDGTQGEYLLEFAAPINDCSWTGAVGDRTGTPVANATVTLNATDDDAVIRALVRANDGTPYDEDFNVTITC